MKLRLFAIMFVLSLTTLTTGCFGLFGSRGPEESATIIVLNDMDPPEAMTIELRKNGDDESTLGTVDAGAERVMTYRSRDLQGAYQLMARQSSGAAVVSREFTLFANAQVRWQMRTNSIVVTESR